MAVEDIFWCSPRCSSALDLQLNVLERLWSAFAEQRQSVSERPPLKVKGRGQTGKKWLDPDKRLLRRFYLGHQNCDKTTVPLVDL